MKAMPSSPLNPVSANIYQTNNNWKKLEEFVPLIFIRVKFILKEKISLITKIKEIGLEISDEKFLIR